MLFKAPNAADFPSFSEGLSLRADVWAHRGNERRTFPFLFGGTFIEGWSAPAPHLIIGANFPSFSEGLSLRDPSEQTTPQPHPRFPFLFGGTFIEGRQSRSFPLPTSAISLPFRRDFH